MGREAEREREITFVVLLIYAFLHRLLLVCALTGDQTHNLGVLGQYSNQLNCPARASLL